ncbi:uncharacterized protein LOC111319393 [Stylophora pistillata]|uniref:AAA+ ATPase domain-containing protein n=1 Tax=Stylophora pistillata TaxID=50429 RepID=A0A2B4R4D9_STYPI|nr:uncharacterized protein LOC111319393 [Stylophora pistillata]PFX11669.1 hypothetical protein AWC38_SpisGene24511 [Stylophora pistillata]
MEAKVLHPFSARFNSFSIAKFCIDLRTGICRSLSLLPPTVPHFVNRKTECQKIKEYLSPWNKCRILLLHGAVGMGKTTVAVKVANDILDSDGRTVVIYVNCRDIKRFDDFAAKILQQVYHTPVDDPAAELKNRLKSQDSYTILFLDNFERLPHSDDPEIKNEINEILKVARKVKLLLTSSDKVPFPEVGQEMVRLTSFEPQESVELLKRVWKDGQVDTTQVNDFLEICSGIPLVLFTLASSHSNLPSLLEKMKCSLPQEKFKFLEKIQTVPVDKKIPRCIDHCFGRLDWKEKCALIIFALFRGRFSLPEAKKMFQSTTMMTASELVECGLELSRRSLLEEHITRDGCYYTLLEVIRDYCKIKAKEPEFLEVILDARRMFIRHFLTFLEDTFKKFLSQDVSKAIAAFQMDEENVLQLVEWCSKGEMDEEQTRRCIDVFNSVAELLAKMMGKAKFKEAFESLRRKCKEMKDEKDEKDEKRLSDCLTSLGIEEVFRSSCHPTGLRASAVKKAKEYLTEADQIQRNRGINHGNSRAQCLSKLARCLAKEGNFDEAKKKVQQAIKIRSDQGEDDKVMLGATYNDQAVILSLEKEHRQAIEVREKQTLPIYKTRLGDHPFRATILNSLSNNYHALGEYDNAKKYAKQALDIRKELLKDHRDTAKSLFDLGKAHKMTEEFEQARYYLKECEAMQKKILDESNDDLTSTRKELEDVKRRLAEAEGQSNGSS